MKKILSSILCLILLVCVFTGCSQPPEFSEIEERLAELIDASYEINEIFFGKGLPVYEHVTDPKENIEVLRGENGQMTYYYPIEDETYGDVIAYRQTVLEYSFAQVLTEADPAREPIWSDAEQGLYAYALADYEPKESEDEPTVEQIKDEESGKTTFYYEIEDETLGRVVAHRYSYTKYAYVQLLDQADETRGEPTWTDAAGKTFAYALDSYEPIEYEYYYTADDPDDYDYVTFACEYQSIASIKEAAEKVYSKDYLESLYTAQFDGMATGENLAMLTAHYMEMTDSMGTTRLLMSNTFKPYVTEKRIFDLSTAKIVNPKHATFITISVESYYESTPNDRFTDKITMILQDGEWMLDSGTY